MAPRTIRRPLLADAGWPVGDERAPPNVLTWTDVTPSTAAHVVAWPFFAPHPIVPAKVFIGLTTPQTGAAAMAGIYTNAEGRPAALVEDLGELDLSATTGKRQFTAGTIPVAGVFWVAIWLKNVATQATIRGASNVIASFLPVVSTGLISSTAPSRGLLLGAAYPASMPAAAPAVAGHGNASVIVPTVEAG